MINNIKEPPPTYAAATSAAAGGQWMTNAPHVAPAVHVYPTGGYPYPVPPPYPVYGTVDPTGGNRSVRVVVEQPEVIIIGGCPSCRIGVLEDYYGLCALCCAIVFFPLGILLCLLMKERRCSHCGAVFD